MKTRKDYDLALDVIGKVVNEWDPYCLLEGGAPKDEFDAEIRQLATYIPRISTPDDASLAVSEVFSKMFEPELFDLESCRDVGKRLYEALFRHNFLTKGAG